MDIKKFQASRTAQLEEFEKDYNFLKTQYSSSLLAAIQEKDPASQQQLIQTILNINTELSNHVRDFLTQMNQKVDSFDPKTLDDLTNDLVQYQKQYQEIEQGKDRLQTLKMIHSTNAEKLKEATTMYNIYLGVLILLCFLIVFMVLRTQFVTSSFTSMFSWFTPQTGLQQ